MTVPNSAVFVSPSSSGQLSNKRGSNTGADAISLQVKYSNSRGSTDPAGTMRVLATKPSAGGGASSTVLDTWWMGAGTVAPMPASWDVRTNSTFIYDAGQGPRVYVAPNSSSQSIYSAPIAGPSVGQWRAETQPTSFGVAGTKYSMVQINGFVYVLMGTAVGQGIVFFAPIQGDGTFGPWTGNYISTADYGSDSWLFAYGDASGNYLLVGGGSSAGSEGVKINSDGSLPLNSVGSIVWLIGASMASITRYPGLYFVPSGSDDGVGVLWAIGGYNNVNGITTIQSATVTRGSIGTWATAGTGIPAGRANPIFAIVKIAGATWLYVIGGSTTTPTGAGTTTIYRLLSTNLGTTVWTTDATALGSAQYGGGGIAQYAPGGASSGPAATVFSFGANVSSTTLRVNLTNSTAAVASITASAGVGAALTGTDLGTGGAVTANNDGSESITYLWGAVAPIGGAALSDGDVVTISIFITDNNSGDISPASVTTIKIGQPPTLSSISPSGATTDCQPAVGFIYNAGAGGGPEYKYQIQVKNNGGAVVADTGLIAGQLNSFSPKLFPMLASGLAASTVITAYSSDIPMSGSLNFATATTAFTPTQTAPSSPGTGSVGVDNVGGSLIPSWKDPLGGVTPTFNRLYWRVFGSSTWLPAKDGIVATQNIQQNFTLMDTIPLNQLIEIGVSSYIITPGSESAIVSCGTGNIQPDYHQDLGGYTAMLHIVGNGLNQRVPIPNIPPIKFSKHIDSESVVMFGNIGLSVRYGPYSYREIDINVIPLDSQIVTLDAVLAAAQAGGVLCYRDTAGSVIYCGLPSDRARSKDLYYADTIKLVELNYTFAP